ncbi:MAG: hypothetical protein ACREU7_02505 [Burkholderiales bacterium]
MTRLVLPLALAAALQCQPAIGQTPARSEITPFAGLRAGGSFRDELTAAELEVRPSASFGLMLDFSWEENSQLEIYLSRQPTRVRADAGAGGSPAFDLNVEYYHIGGTVMLDRIRDFDTYLVATVGATRLDPSGSALDPETRVSLSIGLGSKYPLGQRLRLRMEGRVFATAMDSDSTIFCSIPGTCDIKVRSDTLIQWEASIGLSFAF